MRVPLSWLTQHVDVNVSATALADKLTFAGVEIENVDRVGEDLAGIVTARVLEVAGHPNADRLVLVRIDAGGEDRSVVCGARNFAPGDIVPWAAPGAKLPGGVEVGRRQVRGEGSDGMLASARELGVFDDHSGILVLPPDTPVGVDLVEAVGLRDAVLHVENAPNRGDTLSMRGIAREVAVLLGTELKPLDLTVPEAGRPTGRPRSRSRTPRAARCTPPGWSRAWTPPARPRCGWPGGCTCMASARSARSSTSPTTCCSTRGSRCTPSTWTGSPASGSSSAGPGRARPCAPLTAATAA
jgi:tRNA-binding EMAP/Myf-like protein